MKRLVIFAVFFTLFSISLSAQNSDSKGPKYKNRKAKEIKSVEVVSAEQSNVKGPKRKNAKTTDLIDSKNAHTVKTVSNKEKGPKAKNKRVGS